MKKLNYSCILYFLILSVIAGISSCSKVSDYNGPVVADKTKPDPPTNIRVSNFEGGAYIIYNIPKSQNTLYIVADYTINDSTGAKRQTKTSYYSDTTVVEGFAESKEYTITLKTVTRSNVESDPVTVKIHPETPAYLMVAESLKLESTFGGVNATARNASGQGITIVYLYNDPAYGKYVIRQQKYFDALDINYPMRGFDTLPKQFGAYVTDRWGNKSPVTYATINPVYEILLDKSKFSAYSLASDIPTQNNFPIMKIWDGIVVGSLNNNFWHSQFDPILTPKPVKPYVITFGIGQLVSLSRFVFYQRNGWDGHYWSDGEAEKFSIWGSASDVPRDAVLPEYAPVGTVLGDWINLGNFDFPAPPSGSPPSSPTQADIQWWSDGVGFELPVNSPKVKFLRFAVSKTWGGNEVAYITELTLYGGK
ncbi:DUF4959 domain-containing protein [Chitinophaga tropicalis]|uniref:DUF4959 domain-containing protein n=1 Tax=Chitinophaga tropicalis TaxID=2683588 RepID=A0A7K1U7T5_9BACT|nr:DUF4959 domain-containing protein [Chitinophaga tropicalis]MVT10356.1 DUF4959 domain-containing protein [Chitinophaga tropicalis]